MADFESLYPGRFLKKEVLSAPKVIRILNVTKTELENDKNQIETKVTMKFKAIDGEGEMILCKSNAMLIAVALGTREYEQWAGHLITIGNDPNVRFGGKKTGGIRVVGSPEMTAPKRVEIKMPRRKNPDVYNLAPTDKQGRPVTGKASQSEPSPEPTAPPIDDDYSFADETGDAA